MWPISCVGAVAELQGHVGCVNRLAWSHDGAALVSVSDDGDALVWRWEGGAAPFGMRVAQRIDTTHTANALAVAILPGSDCTQLATGGLDNTVLLHRLTAGAAPAAAGAGASAVGPPRSRREALRRQRDGSEVAYSRGWSTETLHVHKGAVKAIVACPDSPFVLWSGAEDGVVMQYDTRDLRVRATPAAAAGTPTGAISRGSPVVSLAWLAAPCNGSAVTPAALPVATPLPRLAALASAGLPLTLDRSLSLMAAYRPRSRSPQLEVLLRGMSRESILGLRGTPLGRMFGLSDEDLDAVVADAAAASGAAAASMSEEQRLRQQRVVVGVSHVAISPSNPHHMLVGASDPYIRLYDRRMMPIPADAGWRRSPAPTHSSLWAAHDCVLRYAPLHMTSSAIGDVAAPAEDPRHSSLLSVHPTHVEFDATGRQFIGSYHGAAAYVWDVATAPADALVASLGGETGAEPPADVWATDDGGRVPWPAAVAASRWSPPPPPSTLAMPSLPTAAASTAAAVAGTDPAAVASSASAAPASSSSLAAVTTLRAAGNDAFKRRDTLTATAAYLAALSELIGVCDEAGAVATRSPPSQGALATGAGPHGMSVAAPLADVVAAEAAVLHTNLSIARLRREWSGDDAAAVLHAYEALQHDPSRWKALLRLVRALEMVGEPELALAKANELIHRWCPPTITTGAQMRAAIATASAGGDDVGAASGSGGQPSDAVAVAALPADLRLGLQEALDLRDALQADIATLESRIRRVVAAQAAEPTSAAAAAAAAPSSPLAETAAAAATVEARGRLVLRNPWPQYPWRSPDEAAGDGLPADSAHGDGADNMLCTRHCGVYSGHTNRMTNIKEACFWQLADGSSPFALTRAAVAVQDPWGAAEVAAAAAAGDASDPALHWRHGRRGYVVCGSDGGAAHVYDRATGVLVGTLDADSDVCNGVRPHPTLPLLATNGIDAHIRLWAPRPGDGEGLPAAIVPLRMETSAAGLARAVVRAHDGGERRRQRAAGARPHFDRGAASARGDAMGSLSLAARNAEITARSARAEAASRARGAAGGSRAVPVARPPSGGGGGGGGDSSDEKHDESGGESSGDEQ